MATTTTNFGWDIPQSTDLVKDGATAIAALGQDIDTAFVDLKGGTTGQVLAKASNTDLDYSWVAQDDSNAIQNAIVDAKGDLIAATAADTPARLAVGTNGYVLTADSAEATGLKWAAVSSGNASYSLINTGGTSLSGSTTTVSGISGMSSLLILVRNGSLNGSGSVIVRFNSDSGNNYNRAGNQWEPNTVYPTAGASETSFPLATMGNGTNEFGMGLSILGANATGFKAVDVYSGGWGSTAENKSFVYKGLYTGSSTISSISITTTATFDAGTIYVYGSAV